MPNQLSKNNRFSQVRSQSGAVANDAQPPLPASLGDAQRLDSDGAPIVLAYWTGTGETGTLTLQLWILDGLAGKFVKADEVTGVAPNVLAQLKAHGASQAIVAIAGAGGASGSSDVAVFAMASTSMSV
jgi:hypothetical protein